MIMRSKQISGMSSQQLIRAAQISEQQDLSIETMSITNIGICKVHCKHSWASRGPLQGRRPPGAVGGSLDLPRTALVSDILSLSSLGVSGYDGLAHLNVSWPIAP
jgi:hypothetical protein